MLLLQQKLIIIIIWIMEIMLILSLDLFHHLLVLQVHGCQFLADAVVNFKKLCNASIQTDGFTLAEVTLAVLGRYTLLLTGSRHSA